MRTSPGVIFSNQARSALTGSFSATRPTIRASSLAADGRRNRGRRHCRGARRADQAHFEQEVPGAASGMRRPRCDRHPFRPPRWTSHQLPARLIRQFFDKPRGTACSVATLLTEIVRGVLSTSQSRAESASRFQPTPCSNPTSRNRRCAA